VGFSVVSDFISPARRGLAMSVWGISQGGGGGTGALLGGLLGANFWPLPFFVVAVAGLIFAFLYLFTFEPERGRSEPELARVFESGGRYRHRIRLADIRYILTKRSNVWLMLQAFLATLVYGSLVWMPRLFIARVEAAGYTLETATISGNLYSLLFQMGFYFAILTGHIGDRWQRRTPGGRARLAMMAMWIAIPFQIAVFFVPMIGLTLPNGGGVVTVTIATIISIVTNPYVAVTFVLALLAVAFSSADLANRRALLSDVNLPEHRGTVIGLLLIAVGLGLALGNALGGVGSDYLLRYLPAPWNYAVALALFQFIFIPAGWCYYRLSKTGSKDIAEVRQVLARRSEESS
jgi:MFS family permease